MGELLKLPNIGIDTERQLNEVGISTHAQLKDMGAKGAWLKIQTIDTSACINRLMGLEGAILGVKKTLLPDAIKDDLRAFYREHRIPR